MRREDRQPGRRGTDASDTELEPPSRYRVLMLDDGGAPSDFIESLLERIFHMNRQDARRAVHDLRRGAAGQCGIYLHEIAETKASEAIEHADARNFDLQMTLERA